MELRDFFALHPRAAIAFSGGVDSAYLLYAAVNCGANVAAYYVNSAFQPDFELRDALRLAQELGARMKVIELDVLSDENIRRNPENRCYFCKRRIMAAICESAAEDGYDIVLDGTNASDDSGDRPGMKALRERGIVSPLRECGLTKPEIRALSKQAGLFTFDKPAYACLATRVPAGEEITAEKLGKIQRAEDCLFELGYTDFRARLRGDEALLQFTQEQLPRARSEFDEIEKRLSGLFSAVRLDDKGRKKAL